MCMKKEYMKKWIKRNLVNIILFGIMFLGFALLGYPAFSDWWNSFHQSRAIMSYAENVARMDTEEYERILSSAYAYNEMRALTGCDWDTDEEDDAAYNAELNFNGNGIMGYVTIDKIGVMLPIYHGTNEAVLQTSIGHLEGSSLPVGGESSHSILTGHRGLPSAKLFTDLDKLVEGDSFTINVLNETYTYEVDQIRVVEPTDLSQLQIYKGKDYCTLVTCTPYGINTHRLLVRGRRIANAQGEAKVVADAMQIEPVYIAPMIGIPMVTVFLIITLIRTRKKKKK